jgi:DeoR/GlpR family transcriptional regulator of sugar metabolism
LRRLNIQQGFFGAHGLNLPEGLTDVSTEEAEVKRALAAMCRTKIAVLDATKWGRIGLASFAAIAEFDAVITDSHAPAEMVEQVRGIGVKVILV